MNTHTRKLSVTLPPSQKLFLQRHGLSLYPCLCFMQPINPKTAKGEYKLCMYMYKTPYYRFRWISSTSKSTHFNQPTYMLYDPFYQAKIHFQLNIWCSCVTFVGHLNKCYQMESKFAKITRINIHVIACMCISGGLLNWVIVYSDGMVQVVAYIKWEPHPPTLSPLPNKNRQLCLCGISHIL